MKLLDATQLQELEESILIILKGSDLSERALRLVREHFQDARELMMPLYERRITSCQFESGFNACVREIDKYFRRIAP